jgi:hypothetical protein
VASFTKRRKVSVKNCAQIVANTIRELGCAFAIAGYALLSDALLPSVLPAHRGWMPYWLPLAAALAQRAILGGFWNPRSVPHYRSR